MTSAPLISEYGCRVPLCGAQEFPTPDGGAMIRVITHRHAHTIAKESGEMELMKLAAEQ